ncbi:Methyltransferase type 11 [Lasiodiplodia theobromae]|uniref:Secondary metabolism regulator laeA n=1 Tax=Lasiodiplodia theobromae TaxID=45133 RepID=A0A5N5DDA6_9PEZI|nr:Methyltransferase type 11 [Lasiodiplodia theobromae]KAB2575729.1 Secondary metabolism regulator laeA [Lasiodiplodia theobromae]KAF4537637.1 Methyltransferase type 11 [Lasiodiplodia theobromae]KAF9639394.1 Methyltransferase type 11 [Lasiodiplodia theobromae]
MDGHLEEQIEFDPSALNEDEPALGKDAQSYTASLKSSILDYTYENGRRYHAEITGRSYWLPNDESELDRLDICHHIIVRRCGDKLHLAPIDPRTTHRILDIGTGTGVWAMEMADQFPNAQILGNDLSPVQPSFVPPNVRFEIDDVEADWLHSAPFDFIHSRFMAGAIKNWPRLMRQAHASTAPGGWVEFQDFDMRFYTNGGEYQPSSSPLDVWCTELIEGIKSLGMDPEPGPSLERWVEDAGFVNVTHKLLPIPTGTWPKDKTMKEIGAFDLMQFLEGFEGLSLRPFTTLRGWKYEEVLVFLAKVRQELKNPALRLQHNLHVVYAQKPLQ